MELINILSTFSHNIASWPILTEEKSIMKCQLMTGLEQMSLKEMRKKHDDGPTDRRYHNSLHDSANASQFARQKKQICVIVQMCVIWSGANKRAKPLVPKYILVNWILSEITFVIRCELRIKENDPRLQLQIGIGRMIAMQRMMRLRRKHGETRWHLGGTRRTDDGDRDRASLVNGGHGGFMAAATPIAQYLHNIFISLFP